MVSKRTQELTSFIVMDVLEKPKAMEREGVHIIHLEVGEPDFDAPACVKAAACRALEDGHTHYTHSLGNLDLREAIALYYRDTYAVRHAAGADHRDLRVVAGHPAGVLGPARPGRRGHHLRPALRLLPQLHQVRPGGSGQRPGFEEDGFQYRPRTSATRITPAPRRSSSTRPPTLPATFFPKTACGDRGHGVRAESTR